MAAERVSYEYLTAFRGWMPLEHIAPGLSEQCQLRALLAYADGPGFRVQVRWHAT